MSEPHSKREREPRRPSPGLALAVALALGGAGGCTPLQQAQSQVDAVQQAAIGWRDRAAGGAAVAGVVRTGRPRLSGEELVLRTQNALPELFAREFSYASQGAQSLTDILETLSSRWGLSVKSGEIAQGSAAAGTAVPAPAMAGSPTDAMPARVQIEYSGTVRGLLDELARRHDLSWRYLAKTQSVEFFKFETRSLSVYLPPGSKSIAASISLAGVSGSAGGATTGGAGDVSVAQNLTVNPWSSVMAGVQSILGYAGSAAPSATLATTVVGPAGRATAHPELGIITVTARPAAQERIASYIESINARFAQNVMIDIKIYNLSLDTQAALGFSLDALYQRLNHYGVSVVGSAPLQAATGTPGRITISSTDAGSRWNGSALVAQALGQFGKVALQTQGQVLAVNGQPSPIQVANELNYLASSATSTAANVGSTSTLTPGTRVVGFTANFLPLILGDNRILLQYQMQISALTALTQVSSGANSIQTPQIASQSLQQQVFVRDGQAIVLFGFDQNRDTVDTAAGLGGASRTASSGRQLVVIVMQVNAGGKDV